MMQDLERRAARAVREHFAQSVARWYRVDGNSPEVRDRVREAARQVWDAQLEGHVCVSIAPDLADVLRSQSIGASRPDPGPLVLEGDRLYLHRLWQAECRLAEGLRTLDCEAPLADAETLRARIDAVFAGTDPDPRQRAVVEAGLSRRLVIVSGGPGTGKTTTLARLLRAVRAGDPRARIAVAAPTGKAAARLVEALAQQGQALEGGGLTVHRLLGLRPDGTARHGPDDPLPWDWVFVDEASMLDLELATRLVGALAPHARLVLSGDRDQLASVEAGAVFAEVSGGSGPGRRLERAVVLLTRNFRQADAPEIARLAAALRDDLPFEATELVARVVFQEAGPGGGEGLADANAIAQQALRDYAPALALLEAPVSVERGRRLLDAYAQHRVLCALRTGPLGTREINARIARRVRGAATGDWYPGRLVLVTRNAPRAGLFNGDLGVCVEHPEWGLRVLFADASGDRWLAPLQVPACEDAWAMTVHKSQGSEFASVDFVPAPRGNALAARELVYTAVTRARERLRIWGSATALAEAASNRVDRHSGLGQRLG